MSRGRPQAEHLADYEADLDKWENELEEYYKCGGAVMHDQTKLLTAKDMLPEATDAAVHLATKDATTYDGFRATIRTSIQYLIDHGKVRRSAAAHVLEEDPAAQDSQSGVSQWPAGEWEMVPPEAFPEGTFRDEQARENYILVMSKHAQRRMRQPTRSQTSSSGPPRDVNDVKCANCNEKGHTAQQCKRPKVESKDRKCHTCGLPGHIAAKCPDKDKRRAKANVVENEKREDARVPAIHRQDRR